MSDKLVRIKNRYDTANNWYNNNPILAAGEIGYVSNQGFLKIGDGSTPWNELRPLNGNRTHCVTGTVQDILVKSYSFWYVSCLSGEESMIIDVCATGDTSDRYCDLWKHKDFYYQYIRIEIEGYNPINWTPSDGYGSFSLKSLTDANDSEILSFTISGVNGATEPDETFLYAVVLCTDEKLNELIEYDPIFMSRRMMVFRS